MKKFAGKRKIFSYTMHHDAVPSRIFPLLCPVREYDWIEVWDCTMVYSESGIAEENCVFIFDLMAGQPEDTFVVSRYEKDQEIVFVRFDGLRVDTHSITLVPRSDGTTDAIWKQVITGVNDKGNAYVDGLTEQGYRQEMSILEKMLNHFLTTGEMLRISEVGGREALLGSAG